MIMMKRMALQQLVFQGKSVTNCHPVVRTISYRSSRFQWSKDVPCSWQVIATIPILKCNHRTLVTTTTMTNPDVNGIQPPRPPTVGVVSQAEGVQEDKDDQCDEDLIRHLMDVSVVRALLDHKRFPVGSYTVQQWQEAKAVLDKIRETKFINKDVVFYSIRLLERLVWELGSDRHTEQTRAPGLWICQPSYYNPILLRWRAAWIRKRRVFKPEIVLTILRVSTQYYEGFHYNKESLIILMNAAIMRSPRRLAPKTAHEWLDTIAELSEVTENKAVEPDTSFFIQVLRAWDVSGLPESGERMDRLVEYMRDKKKVPVSVVCFNLLIRYWAKEANTGHIQQLQNVMKEKDGLEPSPTTLAHIVYGYTLAGKIEQAETLLRDMLVLGPQSENEWELVGQCTQQILLAYRRIILSDKRSGPVKQLAADRAEKLYIHVHNQLKVEWRQHKLTLTLMDMFIRTGQRERAESLVLGNVTPDRLTLLFKVLGKHELADRAAQIFYELVDQNQIEPDLKILNVLLKAWALSFQPELWDQAVKTMDFLENSPRCSHLHPDQESYNTLLECLSVSKQTNSAENALGILHKMEKLHREGIPNIRPNITTYNLTIRTCLQAGDEKLAVDVLQRMEESQKIIPDRSTFTEFLVHCSEMASPEAGERALEMIDRMRQNATKYGRKFLGPNVNCYNLAITTCTRDYRRHQDIVALERAWKLYQQMLSIEDRKRFVRPNDLTFTRLLTTLTKVKDAKWMERADEVLLEYAKSHNRGLRPSEMHFDIVMNGWNAIGETEQADSWGTVKVKILKSLSYNHPHHT